jgi:N utilization substance protein B
MSGRRSRARLYAVLALYQWQLTGQDPLEIGRHFFDDPAWIGEIAQAVSDSADTADVDDKEVPACDRALFEQIIYGVPANLEELDARLRLALDRPIERVDPVERAILRAGAFELLYSPAVPYRVVINEAIDLAKLLGAEQGHRYVNGVLDRVARGVRRGELGADAAAD